MPSNHISLMHGWLPVAIQAVAGITLSLAAGWRSRRWRLLWLPSAAVLGVATAVGAHRCISTRAPQALFVWIALAGMAIAILLLGWRGARWWRRGLSILAVPLCLLCSLLVLNQWVGYFQTVQSAWSQFTSGPLPDQTDRATVTTLAALGAKPPHGSLVPVQIPEDASHFKHREELVYLPPAWFASYPPPQLPTVLMIGGMVNTPADWVRAGNAVDTVDAFAAAHGGNSPVLVFADPGGALDNDTECVNGSRGNAADHLTKDIQPFMVSNFGVSADRANWGVAGWSMGGTCAVDLAVMHPEMFRAFVDIAGDRGPNVGPKDQSVARLFGGDQAAWAAFDPVTVMTRHGRYADLSGWFEVPGADVARTAQQGNADPAPALVASSSDPAANPEGQDAAAHSLCAVGAANGIACAVVTQPGKHDWPFAAQAFATALPWLAWTIGTPNTEPVQLPQRAAPPPR